MWKHTTGERHGPETTLASTFHSVHRMDSKGGHVHPITMQSGLLPSQRAVIAMSRAQYLAYLHSSQEDRRQRASNPASGKDMNEPKSNSTDRSETQCPADRLSVGACIFRLDGQTLRPAVLLLRRSPGWCRRRGFASVGGRKGAGEWELPGGKVENEDFSISTAIERLVRQQTGLRVTKIMFMLSDVRWREEIKVMLLNEDEEGKGASEDSSGDAEGDGYHTKAKIKVALAVDRGRMGSIESNGSGRADNSGGDRIRDGNRGGLSSGEETLVSPPPFDLEALETQLSTDSSSSGSSPLRLTLDSGSSSISAPPVPPKDPGRFEWGYREFDDSDDLDKEYHADFECDDEYYGYDLDEDHDPSLKPAPLSLPARSPLRRPETPSPMGLHRRNGQVIPHKILRKEYVQLNFTVLVDEVPGGDPVPGFLRQHADNHDGNGGKRDKDKLYQHDALEWATRARVETLPMGDDLRRVVFEGLDWMGSLTGGFF